MAGAYRCAAQPATRVWLDCYYGAAQPVRAALGLPPAPSAQVQLSQAPSTAAPPADEPLRNGTMVEAARCAALAEDRRWLDCFYAAANPVRAALSLAPLAAGPVIAHTGPPPPRRAERGFLPSIFGQSTIEVQAHMVSYAFDLNRNFTITLDNGQVWRQISGDSGKAAWHKPAARYLVTITAGALGSHNLTVKDVPGMFKVRRVS